MRIPLLCFLLRTLAACPYGESCEGAENSLLQRVGRQDPTQTTSEPPEPEGGPLAWCLVEGKPVATDNTTQMGQVMATAKPDEEIYKGFCEGITNKNVCEHAYNVLDIGLGLGVQAWQTLLKADSMVSLGPSEASICAMQAAYAEYKRPTCFMLQGVLACDACKTCCQNGELSPCYENLDKVAMNLAKSFVDSVKWYMSSLTRSVSYIKYMQRVALDYSVDKAYDMVMKERVVAKTPPPARQQIQKATSSMFKKINVATVAKSLRIVAKVVFKLIPETAEFEEETEKIIDATEKIVSGGIEAYKMTCEMVSGLRSTAPSPEDSEDEEGHLGYQNVGPAERAAYEKDNIRASWFITQDDLVAGIKTQMQNVVASAEKRDQMKQGRVDLEGLFDPDPERQKGQNAAMDAKTGWALEEGKVMRTNSIAFQFADDYVRYHAYMALLPAAFRVCVENDYICKQSPMMRERIREPDMFDCCMSEDPETANIFSSKSKLHAIGCNKCTPTSCFREQASYVGGGLLWAPSDPPVASKPNPVPKEFSDPHRWYMHGGPCSKYEYVTNPKFPGDRGRHQERKTKYCQIVEDWSVTRSSEVKPGSLSGWLCGFDSDSEVDMSKNFQPNNALQSDLDTLVSRFTGYELNKTEGYATFGAMLKQDVVGPVRKPFAVAGGFSLEILRLPNARYVNSPSGRTYIYSENVQTKGCKLHTNFDKCQQDRKFYHGDWDGKCGREVKIDETCFKGEAEGPLIPVPSCSKAYCNNTCNTKSRRCTSNQEKEKGEPCDCSGCNGCPKCQQVIFGPNVDAKETVCTDLEENLTCPTEVSKKNWLNQDSNGDIFVVKTVQEQGKACATKKGYQPSWNINLAILCCP